MQVMLKSFSVLLAAMLLARLGCALLGGYAVRRSNRVMDNAAAEMAKEAGE